LHELDSGTTDQAYLLTLPDGRNFQVAAAVYHLAELLDGRRTYAEVAADLTERVGRAVSADDVIQVIHGKLARFGVLGQHADPSTGPLASLLAGPMLGSTAPFPGPASAETASVAGNVPPGPPPDAALGIFARMSLVPAHRLAPIADVAKHFFHPPVAGVVLALLLGAHVYAYQQLGPLLANFTPFSIPVAAFLLGLLLVQLVIPWHELGHAAAVRYFGARHGSMGVGLMGISVVAFVDVSDTWRLSRWQRLVVDLGGLYFQSMTVILAAVWAWSTGQTDALWIVLLMDFAMLMNLNPLFKLDGYWAASDITGIPNLHRRVGEQLGQLCARTLLAGARVLRVNPFLTSAGLQQAARGNTLGSYGGKARLGLLLYCVLFVVSAIYFILIMLVMLPIAVVNLPMMFLICVGAVVGATSGAADPGQTVMLVLHFAFTLLFVAGMIGMIWTLVRSLRRRPPATQPWGPDFRA
jgi:putative peptide zinc metalloprotease protein